MLELCGSMIPLSSAPVGAVIVDAIVAIAISAKEVGREPKATAEMLLLYSGWVCQEALGGRPSERWYYDIDVEGIVDAYEHGLVFTRTDIARLIATNRLTGAVCPLPPGTWSVNSAMPNESVRLTS
jgi:hypothetical protein